MAEPKDTMLLVANYDSNVGYAWWLMESFWKTLAERYAGAYHVMLAYPSISTIPESIRLAPITTVVADFRPRSLSALMAQIRFVRAHRVRVIYFTDRPALSLSYAVLRAAGVRHILAHDHTPGNRSLATGVRRVVKRALHRLPMVNVDALLGATSFVTERHKRVNVFPAARCFTVENGLPPRAAVPAVDIRTRFAIPGGRQVVVTVGRAHRVKGIDVVLDAIAELVVQGGRRDLHLLHCGDGPDLERFAEHARALGIAPFVTFAGRQANIPGILRSCDIAIHASTAEVGFSLAVLEYMEAGLPVIVSDDRSVSGATQHQVSGLHFRTGDAGDAALALQQLLDDPALARRMGECGAAQVRERFSLARTHAMLLEAAAASITVEA